MNQPTSQSGDRSQEQAYKDLVQRLRNNPGLQFTEEDWEEKGAFETRIQHTESFPIAGWLHNLEVQIIQRFEGSDFWIVQPLVDMSAVTQGAAEEMGLPSNQLVVHTDNLLTVPQTL